MIRKIRHEPNCPYKKTRGRPSLQQRLGMQLEPCLCDWDDDAGDDDADDRDRERCLLEMRLLLLRDRERCLLEMRLLS